MHRDKQCTVNSIAASDTVSVDGLLQSPTAVGEMLMAGRIAPQASLSHARAPPFAPPSGLEGGIGRAERRFGCGETVCGKE